jgi:NAD(P)H-dependent FMN reductase
MTKSLSIIIGSTRTNRIGRDVAEWVADIAKTEGFDTVELLDLKDESLPKFDAPVPPMYAAVDTPEAKAWAAKIDAAEHLLVLTPEYNRSVPASLKTAIDNVYGEWNAKPTAIVSYGYIGGGANAAKHLRESLEFLKTDIVAETAALQLSEEIVQDGFSGEKVADTDKAALRATIATLANK